MIFEALEIELIDRLKSRIPEGIGIEVDLLPENQAGFERPLVNGIIWVCYNASKFSDTMSTSAIVQEETITLELRIQSTKLRGAKGIYAIEKLTRAILLGFRPQVTGGKITIEDFGFTEFKENLWTYTMQLQTKTLTVEAPKERIESLLKWITLNDGMGDIIEIPEGSPFIDSTKITIDDTTVTI